MGKEWSKAVGIIFKQKYSKGRGKLSDAMKDPATRALHAQLKGGKTKKKRGGNEPKHGVSVNDGDNGEDPEETTPDPEETTPEAAEKGEAAENTPEAAENTPEAVDTTPAAVETTPEEAELKGGNKKLTLASLDARLRALESKKYGGFPASKRNKSKTNTKSGKKTGGSRKRRATKRR
jgi:hypothetical protein